MNNETNDASLDGDLEDEHLSQQDSFTGQVSSAEATTNADRHTPSSTRRRKAGRLKAVAGKIAGKVRPHPFADEDKPALNEVRHDAAFNPTKVEQELNLHRNEVAEQQDQNGSVVSNGLNTVMHPRKAAKQKIKKIAAGQLTSGSTPIRSRAGEMRFLDANSALNESAAEKSGVRQMGNMGETKSDGQILEDRRDSLRAAWTTSHLQRVRVVGINKPDFPLREKFTERDENGRKISFDWPRWLGHLILYYSQKFSAKYIDQYEKLPFDIDSMRAYVERLILDSGHWQAWLMDVRSVYRWENPLQTAKWYALYAILWYTSRIMTFFWAYILYRVISNRDWSHSVKHVQAAATRALDRESTAFQIGELIDRHGQDAWIDPLIQEVGPYAQLQLKDLADLLEILHNFYSWKSPRKTMVSLFFFAACLLVSLFASMEFCMKVVWFVAGHAFFLCWTISSRYPQYRLLVSPVRWVLWDIPTHSELSFQYLRSHAQLSREDLIRHKVKETYEAELLEPKLASYAGNYEIPEDSQTDDMEETLVDVSSDEEDDDWHSAASAESILSGEDMLSFRAHWKGSIGRLYLYSTGLRFVRNFPRREMWDLPYAELEEMRKAGLGGHRKLTLGGLFDSGVLEFTSTSGEAWTLDPLKHRDEAFNCVIGFSGLQWQGLQTEPGKGRKAIAKPKQHEHV